MGSKFYGAVGFSRQIIDDKTQIAREESHERFYKGDVLSSSISWENDQEIHDDLRISNRISIIADSFFKKNIGAIRYVVISDTRWKVTKVEFKFPRLILSLGGVYNGE